MGNHIFDGVSFQIWVYRYCQKLQGTKSICEGSKYFFSLILLVYFYSIIYIGWRDFYVVFYYGFSKIYML